MKTLSCVCLPDRNSSSVIKKLTQKISKKCNSKNALLFPPHFSLMGDFKISDHDFEKLKKSIEVISKNSPRVEIKLQRYGFYPWKLVFLDIKVTRKLKNLHEDVLEKIKTYKQDWTPEQYKNNKHFSGKQLEYIKKYGYHFCHEYFSPHFTLAGTDMSDESFEKIKSELSSQNEALKVQIDRIAFFDRENENKIIEQMKLC